MSTLILSPRSLNLAQVLHSLADFFRSMDGVPLELTDIEASKFERETRAALEEYADEVI